MVNLDSSDLAQLFGNEPLQELLDEAFPEAGEPPAAAPAVAPPAASKSTDACEADIEAMLA